MAHCKNCGEKLSYWRIFKTLWLGYGDVKCKNCAAFNEHVVLNRMVLALFIASLLLSRYFFEETIANLQLFGFSNFVLFYVIMVAALMLISPFLCRFRLKEESKREFKNPSKEY